MVDIKIQLPNSFFEEEERWGFKITRERKELWAIELDLLCELDRVCKKLGLQYFLDSGTLLGAIRDGHFIPWDDDIDVVMLREDYDRFLQYAPTEFSQPMFLQNAYTDVDYRRGLSQLRRSDTTFILKREIEKKLPFNQGICIDIFPLDGLPPEGELERFFEEKQALRKKIGDLARIPEHEPVEVRELFQQYEQMCSHYTHAEYIDVVMHQRDTKKLFRQKREWFSKTVTVKFEEFYFPAPSEYRNVLTRYYGSDYMTPKILATDHGEVELSTEIPYTEMLKRLQNI